MKLLESSIKNLQLVFQTTKQNCLDCLQINKYELCDTISEISQDKEKKIVKTLAKNQKNLEETLKCGICEEWKPENEFFSLECSHKFCEECYKSYLKTSLDSQGFLFLQSTICPMENCKVTSFLSFLLKLILMQFIRLKWI